MSIAERVKRITDEKASRILILDIERLPGLAYAWEPKTRFIPPDRWQQWPRMVCFAARWYGTKRPIFAAEWTGREEMVAQAWELYDEADIVVTYNGVRFDNPHMRSEWIEAGMSPPRPWRDVDLFQVVKRQFGWESKSLDQVSKRLDAPGKVLRYDMELAMSAVEGDTGAQRKLRRYNVGDVELTEFLYDALRGWIPNHPHVAAPDSGRACPQCGSRELELRESEYRAVQLDYELYTCRSCGGHCRGTRWVSRAGVVRGVRS